MVVVWGLYIQTHSTVTQLCVRRLNVLPLVCHLCEVGQHVLFGYSDMVKSSKPVVHRGETCHGLWTLNETSGQISEPLQYPEYITNVADCNPRKDLVVI